MLHLGKLNTLEIERESPHGLYLTDEIGNEVLLPNKFVTEEMNFGEDIEVFLYKDSEGRNVATTEQTKLQVGEIALLKVFDVNEIGAFMEWGVEKHLLIPFRNQGRRLSPGDETLVYMYLDEETHRLVGTTKLMKYMDGDSSKLKVGAGVELMMWHATTLGYTAIIDGNMVGLVYQDDIYEEIWPGEIKHGFIKRVREDGKIDLSLRPFGYNKVTDESQKILDYLEKHGGTMEFTDKSNPERISRTFRMSKKVFKKALGLLYKQKLVVLEKDSTRLANVEGPEKTKEAPKRSTEAPKKSREAPKEFIEGPIEYIEAPKSSAEAAKRSTEAPKSSAEAAKRSTEAPKKSKEAPEKNWEAPKKSKEAPEKNWEAPVKSTEAPKEIIEGPIEDIEAPNKVKEALEKNWEALEKSTEESKEIIEAPIEDIETPKKSERPIWPED